MKNFLGGLIAGLFLFGSQAHAVTLLDWMSPQSKQIAAVALAMGVGSGIATVLSLQNDPRAKCVSQKTPGYLLARASQHYREMSPSDRAAEFKADYTQEDAGDLTADAARLIAVAVFSECGWPTP